MNKIENLYKKYKHSVRSLYGMNINFPNIDVNAGPDEIFSTLLPGLIERTNTDVLDNPFLSKMHFHNKSYLIPIINQEGFEWYHDNHIMNFDFYLESYLGQHENAKVIYDIGGHQGVWSIYYSSVVEREGRVYYIEPSPRNVEIACLSFLINNIENVVIVPVGIGTENTQLNSNEDGLLISGNIDPIKIMRLDWLLWDKPDFIKIDIEGFEYELVKSTPLLFDYCENIHLEIHIPHLNMRNIDWKDIYSKIPFDRRDVYENKGGTIRKIDKSSDLQGFSTVLITKASHNS